MHTQWHGPLAQEDFSILILKLAYERFDIVKQKGFEQMPDIVGYIREEIKQDNYEEQIKKRPIEAMSLKNDGDDRNHFYEIVIQFFFDVIINESVVGFEHWDITIYVLMCHLCNVQSLHDF
jgi:hypothetical protein